MSYLNISNGKVSSFYNAINEEIGSEYKFQYDSGSVDKIYRYWIIESFCRNAKVLKSLSLIYFVKRINTVRFEYSYEVLCNDVDDYLNSNRPPEGNNWKELYKSETYLSKDLVDFIKVSINKFKEIRKQILIELV
jgi:hypothetical protein